jgi:hypothetical protein
MAGIAALIGAHGTGKTTAFDAARGRFEHLGIKFLPDLARECPYPVGLKTTARAQLWILLEQVRRERVPLPGMVVCDKSVIDHYAYIAYWYGRRPKLEQRVLVRSREYDLLIKFPLHQGFLVADDLRPTDVAFQVQVDGIIEQLIDEWALNVERVPSDAGSDTPNWVCDCLQRWVDAVASAT